MEQKKADQKKTFRPVPGLRREDEEKQLSEILMIAQENLERTEGRIRELSKEVHDLMETYGPKDKEGLSLLHNTLSQLGENRRDLLRCQKARKKPYFGRIDFRDPHVSQAESYYVGRVGISKNGVEPVVIDWRAPVASVYYENALGPCRYVVKNEGTYEIDLQRKRTYEIVDDRLKDFFDSDVVANDELLTKYLAKSKKAVLGEIIATIQKEQNAIIRKSPKTNLIVQGVAGSGKTTVAMHRISYILYNYEEDFRPEDFYIIGSNRILLNYITSVLPDLDVYGVAQMTMEQLFVRLLYEDWNPKVHQICAIDKKDQNACVKGSYAWFHDLEDFCREYERRVIPIKDVWLENEDSAAQPEKDSMASDGTGVLLLDASAIEAYRAQNPQVSVQGKINMLNEMLLAKLENELTGKYVSYTAAEKRELKRKYRWYFGKDIWKGSIFEVYQEFLQTQREKGKAVPNVTNQFDVYDLAALAYLYKRMKETDGIREASHIIIDEAQDFGMMAYGALAYCLRGCTYTIMGDVSQNIYFGYGLNDWRDLQDLILTGTFDSFGLLKKSYRNTVEISDFATEILRHGSFPIYPVDPIRRHGNPVCVEKCADENNMIQKAADIIAEWLQAGHETIAVICRDEGESAAVSDMLGKKLPLADCNPETAEFGSGVMVLPVEYTKGLEFDAVLLYHPSAEHYPAEDSYVKLLYVAATRALHEMAVLHIGDLTDLIGKPVSEEKRMSSLENEAPKERRRFADAEITAQEQMLLDAKQGDKERAMRGYIGPKAIKAEKPRQIDAGGSNPDESDAGADRKAWGGADRKAWGTDIENQSITGMKKRCSIGTKKQGITDMKIQGTAGTEKPGSVIRKMSGGKGSVIRKMSGGKGSVIRKVSGGKDTGMEESDLEEINMSPYRFGDIPDNSILRPQGHSRVDCAVRMVRKTKQHIDLISSYGILRLMVLEDAMLRIQFLRGQSPEFEPGRWNYRPEKPAVWTAKEGRSLVEIATGKIVVRVEKKTGALQFFDRKGRLLLAEKAQLPRQMDTVGCRNWMYFDWQKNEKLAAKGVLADQTERMTQMARYISFGGKKLRMPLLYSSQGYGIGVAARGTVLCCAIPMYGPYLYTEGEKQIDYYFLHGENYEEVVKLYRRISL
ncbi:MAG: AAA family ATPase [Marvinbryantia sp.]|mgnify:FL=1|uniref:AAA family ATPase n=1 Tax=Marvinbryantia sp. TaxID=2496532 RepID=UPI0025CCB907|nr:AAA family ATPase [uncultured Marvinbryantia sp.]